MRGGIYRRTRSFGAPQLGGVALLSVYGITSELPPWEIADTAGEFCQGPTDSSISHIFLYIQSIEFIHPLDSAQSCQIKDLLRYAEYAAPIRVGLDRQRAGDVRNSYNVSAAR